MCNAGNLHYKQKFQQQKYNWRPIYPKPEIHSPYFIWKFIRTREMNLLMEFGHVVLILVFFFKVNSKTTFPMENYTMENKISCYPKA